MIKKIKRFFSVNWILTIYANIYYLGIKHAFYFPILLGFGVKINSFGDRFSVSIPFKFGSLCFGLKGGPFSLGGKSFWHMDKGAKLKIQGTARISKGTSLKLFSNAELIVGDHFSSNANLILSCAKKITIGKDNLFGWNVTIMDNDGGHTIMFDGVIRNLPREIHIGDHVWIAAESSILKGSLITNDSVIGYKSNVCGLKCIENNSVIVGNPAVIKSTGFQWNH